MDSNRACPNFDFLMSEIDDVTLSQVCEQLEKENDVFEGFDLLSVSQTMRDYEIKQHDYMEYEDAKMDAEMTGNFELCLDTGEVINADVKPTVHFETERFMNPMTDTEVKELLESQENVNTKKNTAWSFRVFESWRAYRNSTCVDKRFIKELHEMTTEEMNYYLGRFILETRKQDGQPYPPRSLYLISCGLLRHLRDKKVYDKNFLCTTNLEFSEFRKILDARMKELLQMGYGTKVKQAQAILTEDEEMLWAKGVFGNSSAETLQCTIFFYACKLFALRGHDEHHGLQCEQFTIGEDHDGKFIEFHGRSNKTHKGGLKDLEISNKTIRHYCQEGDRNMAEYFKQYIEALGNRGVFYRRPLHGLPVRYGEQSVGINKLKNFMKIICERGGLKGNYTNHSGKRTCATQLYMAGVDEQEIMARTGHRSEKSVRKYKQSSAAIQRKVAALLDPPTTKSLKRDREGENEMSVSNSKKFKCEGEAEMIVEEKRNILHEISNRPVFANCNISFNLN